MTHLLVKTSHDWADEFDCTSVFCMKKDEFELQLNKIQEAFENGEICYDDEFYFGTNEALQFHSFKDFVNGVETVEVSKEFADTFGDHIGCRIFVQLYDAACGE